MRKTLAAIALTGLLLSSVAFAATTYTETLYPATDGTTGNNLIALRGVPFNPDPLAVFGDVNLIDGTLTRLVPTNGNTEAYYSFQEPGGPFGNMLLGDGYQIQVSGAASVSISYSGIEDGVPSDPVNAPGTTMTDMWISLPGLAGEAGGYHLVGNPFNHNILFTDVKVTDGTQTIPVLQAIADGWLDGYWAYLDAPTQNTMNVDPDEITGSASLEPGRAYIVFTRKSNIALIIPAGVL